MELLIQFGIIIVVSFAAELLNLLIPLPIPTSVYGLVLMFLLLKTGLVKLKQIEKAAGFFLAIMPLLFISPNVSLMVSIPALGSNVIVLLIAAMISTVVVMAVTGSVAQLIVRLQKRGKRKKAK